MAHWRVLTLGLSTVVVFDPEHLEDEDYVTAERRWLSEISWVSR